MSVSFSKDFIASYDDALSPDECSQIIGSFETAYSEDPKQFIRGEHQFHNGNVGRSDLSIAAVNCSIEVAQSVNNAVHACLLKYCDEFFVLKGLQATSKDAKLQRTDPRGGYHVWHCEQDCLNHASRLLAWMIYLNDIPAGEGETEFLWQGLRIKPKAGTCIFWPAAYTHTHRGNPVYTHPKYVATGWYTFM